jgi:hypothetical protein
MKYYYALIILLLASPVFGIVPKPDIAIERYEKPAIKMNHIGHLIMEGEKINTCSAALIGADGNIGVVLTAGHCVEIQANPELTKCRDKTISFSPYNTYVDPQQLPIIGQYALSNYIDKSKMYEYDLGLVFVDLTDINLNIQPAQLQLSKEKINALRLVQVAGYGKTNKADALDAPKRRIMSTNAMLVTKNDHEMLLLDDSPNQSTLSTIPIGQHPAEGDSGGPIIDPDSGAVIGVVSHKSGALYYSEPLYEHAEWLLAQLHYADRYFVFKPRQSGNFSSSTTWSGEHIPIRFKNHYGEINPIVVIDGKKTLTLDNEANPYAINIVNEGGSLDIQTPEQHVETVGLFAPSTIKSSHSCPFITDDLSIATSDISLQTKVHVLHGLHIKEAAHVDIEKEDRLRGITLLDKGLITVDGTLKAHHLRFADSPFRVNQNDIGQIHLLGTLQVHDPIQHTSHMIEVRGGHQATIQGSYMLLRNGMLSFKIESSSPSSEPLLRITERATLSGGKIVMKGDEVLPIGYERTLLSSTYLNITEVLHWEFSTKIVDDTANIVLMQHNNQLKMKVVPRAGFIDSEDSFFFDPLSTK